MNFFSTFLSSSFIFLSGLGGGARLDLWGACPESSFENGVLPARAGMGESYMDGDYEVDDLGAFLAVATANATNIEVRPLRRVPWAHEL